jgi:phospholipid-binding lipoprotein MlaA
MRALLLMPLLLCCLLVTACSTTKQPAPQAQEQEALTRSAPAATASPAPLAKGQNAGDSVLDDSLDDYDEMPRTNISDPLEPWNRFWFSFNDGFYTYVADPMYRGYAFVMPHEFRNGLRNFLYNLLFPLRFVNNLLQGRPLEAGVEFGRFIVNSTVGIGGLFDVTKDRKTIVPVDPDGEDLGQTLGRWGIGHGIYIVWPFLGPSSVRESIGLVGDAFTDPLGYYNPILVQASISTVRTFNNLDSVLETYNSMKEASLDPYVAAREAYIAYRNRRVEK